MRPITGFCLLNYRIDGVFELIAPEAGNLGAEHGSDGLARPVWWQEEVDITSEYTREVDDVVEARLALG